jgi:hypothetical protein
LTVLLDSLGQGAETDTEFLSDGVPGFATGDGELNGLGFELGRELMRAFFGWRRRS